MKRLVLVFLKFPEPGRVKTRLARAVGDVEAAGIYRLLTAEVFRLLANLEGVALRVLYDPPDREEEVVEWISGLLPGKEALPLDFAAQVPGDLGQRLLCAFETAFEEGFEAVAAVGTDCVDMRRETFSLTWEALGKDGGADVVLGPSEDGGYYLVAMNRFHGGLFAGIPWSSAETFEATLAAARSAGLETGRLETLRDVDALADWEAVAGRMKDCGGERGVLKKDSP